MNWYKAAQSIVYLANPNGGFIKMPATYLRFGDIPKGYSQNSLTGRPERGVSVVYAWKDPKTSKYVVETGGEDLIGTLGEVSSRQIFEVSGKEIVDVGGDGEPLLDPQTIKVIKVVQPNEVVTVDDPWLTMSGNELLPDQTPKWYKDNELV